MTEIISTAYNPMPSWTSQYSGSTACSGSGWENVLVINQAFHLSSLLLRISATTAGQAQVVASLDGESSDIDIISAFAIGTTAVNKSASGFFAPVLLVQANVSGTVTLQIAAR